MKTDRETDTKTGRATAVHVAIYDGLADWEAGLALAHINSDAWKRRPGSTRVVTVGESAEPITTMGGMRVLPDMVLAELEPGDSAMLILPGADSWLTGGNGAFVDAARRFLEAGVPVAAICGATVGLAAAGLLDERAHTSNARVVLEAVGYGGVAHYRDTPACTDGDLITASATAPVPFAREILARLDVYTPEVLDAWYKLYGLGDPAGYEELMAATAS